MVSSPGIIENRRPRIRDLIRRMTFIAASLDHDFRGRSGPAGASK
jgi:hypothetical protein